MRSLLLVSLVLGLGWASFSAQAAAPVFEIHTIDHVGKQLGQTALADLDHDGDLDYVCGQSDRGARQPGQVWWWEYQGPDTWVRHELGVGKTDVGGALYDVNGDGWLDMIAGAILLVNPGDPRTRPFTAHEIMTLSSHDTGFADFNGDGKMDAYANSDKAGLFWFEAPADPTRPWASHPIAKIGQHKVHGGPWPRAAGDLDGDGDTDLLTAQAWHENADGKGLAWRQHTEPDFLGRMDKYGIAVRTWLLDMDGDKDLDFVQAEADHPNGRIAWFENDGKARWTRHMIREAGKKEDFHSLAVADFDGDGDADVFAGAGPLSEKDAPKKSYIWENPAGGKKSPGSQAWPEHKVTEGRECHDPVCGDVDADGDVDIIFKPWQDGNEHVYLRNMLNEKKNQ